MKLNYKLDHYDVCQALLWGNFVDHCKKAHEADWEGHKVTKIGHALIAAALILPGISQIGSLFEYMIVTCFAEKTVPYTTTQDQQESPPTTHTPVVSGTALSSTSTKSQERDTKRFHEQLKLGGKEAASSQPPPLAPLATNVTSETREAEEKTTRFIALGGVSQHANKFHTQQLYVGEKQNQNGTQPVYLGDAGCTPLAIAFAADAEKLLPADAHTPSRHIEEFFQDPLQVTKGIEKVKEVLKGKLEEMNLDVANGLKVFNAMRQYKVGEEWVEGQTFIGGKNGYDDFSFGHRRVENSFWYMNILMKLKSGQGAVVVVGGYSFAVRRINNTYEIFDSHNSAPYTDETGACVISCPDLRQLQKELINIFKKGTTYVVDDEVQVEITLLGRKTATF